MIREYLIDPAYDIWQFQVLPGVQTLWDSVLFWRLIVLVIVAFLLMKTLQRKKED
jgi:hypothetical protein